MALSVPPAGWWPLGIVGMAVIGHLLAGRRWRARALVGFSAGIGLYSVTLFFIVQFNAFGAVVVIIVQAAFLMLAAIATPSGPWRAVGWPAAIGLTNAIRSAVPFGGLPMGGIELGQASGPLAPAARLGGALLVGILVAVAGLALEAVVEALVVRSTRYFPVFSQRARRGQPERARRGQPQRARRGQPEPARGHPEPARGHPEPARGQPEPARDQSAGRAITLAVAVAVAVGLPALGAASPDGRAMGALRTAVVQGGGPRGLRAIDNPPSIAYNAQLGATAPLSGHFDLVLWPENTIAMEDGPVRGSAVDADMSAQANRLGATIVAGITEPAGPDHFLNAAVAWAPQHGIVARYDKVHRVPFGEYVPGRRFIAHFVNLDTVPRDALAGHGSGLMRTPAGPLGVVISYEVFYANRARSAIRAGGQVLLVPTNTASYTTAQVPDAEIATARLRAWETGRDVVMAAPTGFSAILGPRGQLRAKSSLGSQAVIDSVVVRRAGQTPYLRWGDGPWVALAVLLLAAAWGRSRGAPA